MIVKMTLHRLTSWKWKLTSPNKLKWLHASPFSDLLRNLALDFIIDSVGDQCKSIVSVYLTIIYHSGNHIRGSIQEDLHESRSLNWERIAGDNKAVSYFFHLLHFVHSIVCLKKHSPCLTPECTRAVSINQWHATVSINQRHATSISCINY